MLAAQMVMRFRVRVRRCYVKGQRRLLLKAVDNAIAEMQKDGTLKAPLKMAWR